MDQGTKPGGALPQRRIAVSGMYIREQSIASGKLTRRQGQSLLRQWPEYFWAQSR